MSLKDKLFYYEKAKLLSNSIFRENENTINIDFEHDLTNSEKKLINDAINLVNNQSKEFFESTIEEFNLIRTNLIELNKSLSSIDADLEDELILEYSAKKDLAEFNIGEKNKLIGENNQQISVLQNNIVKLKQELIGLYKKVGINEQNNLKIKKANAYIKVLAQFLEEQKNIHKNSLEKNILSELKILMHKLSSKSNQEKFIEGVEVTILASGQGMKVTLLDQYKDEIRKESLSSGEKQIYISCLIKAIIHESVKILPVFIDTPLGRLDEEHRDNITRNYYPKLSDQVILFSTNSEITPKRFIEISDNISKSYLLFNDGSNTTLKRGYFNTHTND